MPKFLLILALLGFACSLASAQKPHPSLPDRWIAERDGLRVEYPSSQASLVEKAFSALQRAHQKAREHIQRNTEDEPIVALSARDLHARREEILAELARQIGLDGPTALMSEVYDTYLDYYDQIELFQLEVASLDLKELAPKTVQIWEVEKLKSQFAAGAEIPGFTRTEDGYEFIVKWNQKSKNAAKSDAIRAAMRSRVLTHTYSRDKDSVSASVSFGKSSQKTTDPSREASKSEADTLKEADPTPQNFWLWLLDEESPTEIDTLVNLVGYLQKTIAEIRSFRDAPSVTIIFHETIEAGLVENYIRSPDRRWLCDGTANYLTWKVAETFSDPKFAKRVYNLKQQTSRYREFQTQLDLIRWSAAENQDSAELSEDLQRAHYAFATQAIAEMDAELGADGLAALWRKVGKTPVKRVTAKTVAKAYLRLTGKTIAQAIHTAETSSPAENASNPNTEI